MWASHSFSQRMLCGIAFLLRFQPSLICLRSFRHCVALGLAFESASESEGFVIQFARVRYQTARPSQDVR